MDLAFTPEDLAFRDEVRAFIDEAFDDDLREQMALTRNGYLPKEPQLRWQKRLAERGWLAPNWPEEYGGPGWTATQKYIYDTEMAAAGAPGVIPFGPRMVAPVIMKFGTPEQKAKYLPDILASNVWWCQGYSEPGAGSDLAALKTKAVRDGDDYIVNGQKIWTSYAHEADWIFCLVRTDDSGKKQEGISFLLIDMTTPGIEVKPIISIAGLHHLNEVFFTDVRVPAANLIGDENKGWTYAKFLLVNERTGIAGVPESKKKVSSIKEIARAERSGGNGALWDDVGFRRKLGEIEIKLTALEYTNLRVLADVAAGKEAGPKSSMLKIVGTEVQQSLAELAVEALGHYAQADQRPHLLGLSNEGPVGPDYAANVVSPYLTGRAATIYGGSNEIQRNVIAKAVLGL